MHIPEANIEIIRDKDGETFISVSMPVWSKKSEFDDNLIVRLPLLGIETIAENEKDAEVAIEEAIKSFCIASDKFGEGIETELQSLGWVRVDHNGNPILGYCVSDADAVIDRLLQTGDNYSNPKLEISEELAHA